MLPARELRGKRILIIHYRVGRTDGVSIEITAWKHILQMCGAKVALCAGFVSSGADYVLDDLENQLNPDIYALGNLVFGKSSKYDREVAIKKVINTHTATLEKQFTAVIDSYKPTNILVSNVFSHGGHIPAAIALTKTLDRTNLPTAFVAHDFYWDRFKPKKITSKHILKTLREYHPPVRDYIKYACINSPCKKNLKKRKGINSEILYDTIDFGQTSWIKRVRTKKFLRKVGITKSDIVILQATRIVQWKNIELSIDYAAQLETTLKKVGCVKLYDGRVFDPQRGNIILLLAGYAEKRSQKYLKKILQYAKERGVRIVHIGNHIVGYDRKNGKKDIFSLTDIYPFADIISYPTSNEGFGNQFLESLFAKKPTFIFEYRVFKTDIKPKGFRVISLGDQLRRDKNGLAKVSKEKLVSVAQQTIALLTNKSDYQRLVEHNFLLGKKYFSYEQAYKVLRKLII